MIWIDGAGTIILLLILALWHKVLFGRFLELSSYYIPLKFLFVL